MSAIDPSPDTSKDPSTPLQEESDRLDGAVRGAATKIVDLGAKTTR